MKNFAQILLSWYAVHKRPLPWRDTQDPYKIWISEIILQQTRVAQGYDYFLRFIKRFPDVQTLAAASQDEVLKYWEGLGYYSRARNLHAAAQSMNGVFPSSYEGVLALKGVGEYTAAAICSFAYKMPYAVVDGNVCRVLSRIFGIHVPIDSTDGKKQIQQLAQKLLDKHYPDDFNQAIMDFGALQCVPQNPDCKQCPFKAHCKACKTNQVASLPVRAGKVKLTQRYFSYIYVEQGSYTYLHRREEKDIWQGLYELPLVLFPRPLAPEDLASQAEYKTLFAQLSPRFLCGPIKHVLSHQVIWANFYAVTLPAQKRLPEEFIRIKKDDLKNYALPRLVQKGLEKAGLLAKEND